MAKKNNPVYGYVTERIIKQLEEGIVPWRRPWVGCGYAMNYITRRPYRGVNALLLPPGEYVTFNQAKQLNGKIKKGAKSHLAVFWKIYKKKRDDADEEETIKDGFPVLRYYKLFHLSDTEGIESKLETNTWEHDPVEQAEAIIAGYTDKPEIQHIDVNSAYYSPSLDIVNIPPAETFPQVTEYYSTTFHELVHSTGHSTRLGRLDINQATRFGDHNYSKEELVAEIGASMLCAVAGIDNDTIANSANYIGNWLQRLQDDNSLIVSAASKAQKAADYIRKVDEVD